MTDTQDLKLVADYTHLNFSDVWDLDCITYKMLLRDAFIDYMKQTEEGRQYLEDAYYLTQTRPDRKSIRKYNRREKNE